jgi:N-acetyl-gamma-glutamyl-phosphate reductase
MLKVSIVGATGYTGGELLKILTGHPKVSIDSLFRKQEKPGTKIDEEFPFLKRKINLSCQSFSEEKIPNHINIVFLSVPHTAAMEIAPLFLKKGIKVIDLSADFRLKDPLLYEKWYAKKHSNPEYLKKAVYGLPELFSPSIIKAKFIANPGCFPTSIILGAAPIIKNINGTLCIDSKTGTSGAGKKAATELIFSEITNNIRPYRVLAHQHTPEIEQILSISAGKKTSINFVPELCPIDRGILSTMFLRLKKSISTQEVIAMYKNFYKKAPFVEIMPEGTFPELKNVIHTNMCHIGLKSTGKELVIISVIDNLVKGAAGQAVQNMNLMFGLPEEMGLR